MWLEITICTFLMLNWCLCMIALFATLWWRKVRANYLALQGKTGHLTQESWQAELDAADEFRENPPWYVKVLSPREFKEN